MKVYRIEVYSKVFDTRASVRLKKLKEWGFSEINHLFLRDVYTIEKQLTSFELHQIASSLSNPVTQGTFILTGKTKISSSEKFDWAIEIGFLPGVTDNIANTTREIIEDLLSKKFNDNENVYTSQIIFIKGDVDSHKVKLIADSQYNPIIQRVHIKDYRQYIKEGGMDFIIPKVRLSQKLEVSNVDLEVADEELVKIGKQGIVNKDGTRQGPLALDLSSLKTIQKYFQKHRRSPTDIELESLAQTWSEHCKHTIFANPMDDVKDGLFKHYIKRATEKIRKKKSAKGRSSSGRDFCVSTFLDNSGAIKFDDKYLITHKVETHNTPSALDPFGGSITGIVGVNRDTIGFGLGAKPVANFYGFCLADPKKDISLYKDSNLTQKMLSSRRIMDGVIEGVNSGGNCSGIPTPQGFLFFDERYRGKPLVFVGTVGLIPQKIKNKLSYIKKAKTGDYIVMIGGRVGKDGIHGATFSSEALHSGSPVTAVQIGDPITKKKLSDAIVKEARNMLLYNSITDNGAGGLSCSVAEMAKESGGCVVDLEKVPLKYSGLAPWEIWVSESQERMTLAVPLKNWKKFADLMEKRGVEATVIGEFTNSGKCVVRYNKKTIMDIDMQFLHNGLPKKILRTKYNPVQNREPIITQKNDYTKDLLVMLERQNIASYEFITDQYDYLVQGELVFSPLEGCGRVNSEISAIRPLLSFSKAVVMSQGIYPSYSDIDTYHMAAASIDTAIRNLIAAGVNLEKIALLDNFCWCSSNDPYRLGQLKRATKACYNYALYYQTPFISGKDSMFNDFHGFDKDGKEIKISIPPTLLISSLGIIDDVSDLVSLDVKKPGDLIYLLGVTDDELGGSEYFAMHFGIGKQVPKVNARRNKKLYQSFHKATRAQIVASSISINRGGLGVALAKMSMGGMLGIEISLKNIGGKVSRNDFALFSESQGRILVTIDPKNQDRFEKIMKGNSFTQIGRVLSSRSIIIRGINGNIIVKTDVGDALKSYRKTFEGY